MRTTLPIVATFALVVTACSSLLGIEEVSVGRDAGLGADAALEASSSGSDAEAPGDAAAEADAEAAPVKLADGLGDLADAAFLSEAGAYLFVGTTNSGVFVVAKADGTKKEVPWPGQPMKPFGLADGTFYAADRQGPDGKVYLCASLGCPGGPTVAASGRRVDSSVVRLGSELYMAGSSGVARCTLPFCGTAWSAIGPASDADELAVEGGKLFVLRGGAIERWDDPAFVPVVEFPRSAGRFKLRDGYGYAIGFTGGGVFRAPLASGGLATATAILPVTSPDAATSFAVDSTYLYTARIVSDGSGGARHDVVRCALASCAGTTVTYLADTEVETMAADDTAVYWVNTKKELWRRAK